MFWIIVVALIAQVGYWLTMAAGFGRVRTANESLIRDPGPPVSVIVAARNEEDNLPILLERLRLQSFPDFEVIVVDDASTDRTAEIVQHAADADDRIRLIRSTAALQPRKKRALMLGIEAARHERLAFTDADCVTAAGWLAGISAWAAHEPDAVLVGYGPYSSAPGALNLFVRYETWITAAMTAAATGLGHPFMAVGRNFSYPRSLFDQVGGFEQQMHSLSGDDDLLVRDAHRVGAPVRYMLDPASIVYTEAPSSWGAWFRQKMRHTSAGRHYAGAAKGHLALFHASNLLVWLAPAFLGWTGAAMLAGRFLVQRTVLKFTREDLAIDPAVTSLQPLLDLGYVVYNTVVPPLGLLFGGKRW